MDCQLSRFGMTVDRGSTDNIFLGSLRQSRSHMQKPVSPIPLLRSTSGLGQDSVMPAQSQQLASFRHSYHNSGSGTLKAFPDQVRRSLIEKANFGPLCQSQSVDKADSDGAADRISSRPSAQFSKLPAPQAQSYDPQAATANSSTHKLEERRRKPNEIHCSKGGPGRPMRSQSTPCLPGVGQLGPTPPPPIATGSPVLDRVLAKLNKPKLLAALDRMVEEVHVSKKTFKRMIKEFDLNGDGILSKEELTIGLRKMGVTLLPSELDAIMRAVDIDQNGSVEVEEFIEVMTLYQSHFKLDQASGEDNLDAQAQKRLKLKSPKRVSFLTQF